MRIQHNIMAMNAYRNYTNNTSALAKNLEKLSSGYKINRAGDDAAGLAISEKMRAQITGLQTAQKNAKDGISLVQTAEGALTEVHDMLNRMVELADQSANGTYDNDVDRANLQKEFDALRSEINRIADSSNFNGINLLDGSLQNTNATTTVEAPTLTGGATLGIVAAGTVQGTNTILHADGVEAKKTKFEVDLSNVSFDHIANSAGNTVTIDIGGATIGLAAQTGDKSASELASLFATASSQIAIGGVSYSVTADGNKLVLEMTNDALDAATGTASFVGNFNVSITTGGGTYGVIKGDTSFATSNIQQGNEKTEATLADTIATNAWAAGSFTDGGGIKIGDTTYVFALTDETKNANYGNGFKVVDLTDLANADGTALDTATHTDAVKQAANRLTVAAADNDMFVVEHTSDGKLSVRERVGYDGDADLSTLAGIQAQLQTYTKVTPGAATTTAGTKDLTLQIGDTSDSFNQLHVSIADMHTDALGMGTGTVSLNDVSISTQQGAADAVAIIKTAINDVSSTRGDLGALQNRLEHTINNLSVMQENIQDAEATIRDVDVAQEMMDYTKNNILVQSAQAMLAQANQVPQGVLQLLQ